MSTGASAGFVHVPPASERKPVNYLAHAALAQPDPHSLLGNLSGDLVKGPLQRHALHPLVAAGVRRHRRVDVLTDSHSEHLSLRSRFPDGSRRYAGIVLDVLFDYFLSTDWDSFHATDRDEFIDGVYAMLISRAELLPEPMARIAPRWVEADWLRVYGSLDGVDAVLRRLAGRLSDPKALIDAWAQVRDDTEALRPGFQRIYVDVRAALDGETSA